MATNVILEYKRSADEWQCPICDAENSMALGNCPVCGGTRSADATILRRWTPTVVGGGAGGSYGGARREAPGGRPPGYGDHPKTYREETSKSGCITALMVVLVVLIMLLTLFLFLVSNGEEFHPAEEYVEVSTELENESVCLTDCIYA